MHDRDDLSTILPGDPSREDGHGGSAGTRAGSSRSARRREREQRRQRKRRRGRRSLIMLVALALVGAAAFGAYTALSPVWSQLTASDDFTGSGSGTVPVSIAKGASATAIGRTLADAGVVKSTDAFVDAAGDNPRSQSIQPGRYTMRRSMSAASAVTLLLDPSSRDSDRVTLREGLRRTQVVAALAKASGRPESEYTAALKKPEALGLPAVAKGDPEGWLFPDTYEFDPDATPAQQLAVMVSGTKKVLAELDVPEAQQREVLVKASIVQAEGGSVEDFGKIARVIESRLDNKVGNGSRLQMDSTVAYGTGKNGIFTTSAERADTSNKYNTYANAGLPVGAIGNPGKAAIEAALHPTPGDWLYFVVVNLDTGETKFSTTAAQHAAYTQQLHSWYAKNR